jgi:hypothetical protein
MWRPRSNRRLGTSVASDHVFETLDQALEPTPDVRGWLGTLLLDPSPDQRRGLDLLRFGLLTNPVEQGFRQPKRGRDHGVGLDVGLPPGALDLSAQVGLVVVVA